MKTQTQTHQDRVREIRAGVGDQRAVTHRDMLRMAGEADARGDVVAREQWFRSAEEYRATRMS